jgi:hypothetical protein
MTFGAVNFAVVLALLLGIYQWRDWQQDTAESTRLLPILNLSV